MTAKTAAQKFAWLPFSFSEEASCDLSNQKGPSG